jgi:hypothetical protein
MSTLIPKIYAIRKFALDSIYNNLLSIDKRLLNSKEDPFPIMDWLDAIVQ